MSTQENSIKERLKSLYRELQLAKRYYMKIVVLLESSKEKEETKEELNGILRNMPEFNELKDEVSEVKNNAKRFCAGNLGKEKFYKSMLGNYKKIVDAAKCINEEQFF